MESKAKPWGGKAGAKTARRPGSARDAPGCSRGAGSGFHGGVWGGGRRSRHGQFGKALAARPWAKSSSRARMTCGRVTTGRCERMMAFRRGKKRARAGGSTLRTSVVFVVSPDQRPWTVMSQPPNAAAIDDGTCNGRCRTKRRRRCLEERQGATQHNGARVDSQSAAW